MKTNLLLPSLLLVLCLGEMSLEATVPGPPSWGSNYQLAWSQDFTTMSSLSVSASGPCGTGGTTWMATKPGGGNWFDFIAPAGNLDPFGIGSGYLDIRVQDNGSQSNGFSGYTGGILASVDNNGNGFSQQYGYFECSMWCPGSPNTWPAFWLLNTSCLTNKSLPYTAEIDITESYGNYGTGPNQNPPGNPNEDGVTWHQWGQNGNPTTSNGTFVAESGMTTGYHTYGVDIEPTTTTWYFDRNAIWSAPTLAQAKSPMFLMMNLALGGGSYNNAAGNGYNWSLTPSPTDLKIQYVAVYASPNSPNYVPGLPSPWTSGDIGSPGATGTSTYASGTFTLKGSGTGLGGTADSFQFADQPITGNCTITARVATTTNSNSNASAGVMIRETTNANSQFASAIILPGGVTEYLRRIGTGTAATVKHGTGSIPLYVRVVRSGNSLSAYTSTDGTTFTQLGGTETISMASNVYIGMSQTSSVNATLTTSTFDNVSVTSP
jgi:beta-glucanase (GH16 family)